MKIMSVATQLFMVRATMAILRWFAFFLKLIENSKLAQGQPHWKLHKKAVPIGIVEFLQAKLNYFCDPY